MMWQDEGRVFEVTKRGTSSTNALGDNCTENQKIEAVGQQNPDASYTGIVSLLERFDVNVNHDNIDYIRHRQLAASIRQENK